MDTDLQFSHPKVVSRLIPFSFSEDFYEILGKFELIKDLHAAVHCGSVKERANMVLGIAKALNIEPLNRKSEKFLLLEAYAITLMDLNYERGILMSDFLTIYEDFKLINLEEQEKLRQFHSMMSIACQVIPPKLNKKHLLDIVTRLTEGKGIEYIPGGGETERTRNRVKIYEKVGEITKPKRPLRITEMIQILFRSPSFCASSRSSSFTPVEDQIRSVPAIATPGGLDENFQDCLRTDMFKGEEIDIKY